ncbi:MAG: IS21 family transposase [Desulfomonilaceae bacterium]
MSSGTPLSTAAMKSGMSEPTARKYREVGRLPSQIRSAHEWRTRLDPFADLWDGEIEPILRDNPGLEAKALFESFQEKYPSRFSDGQLRTMQRRFREWRALHGEAQEVFFPQRHRPGELGSSDFTEMNSLGVTIQGKPFRHLLYHFVLTYSNWESGSVCFAESFESLAEGLQNALWKLGGVPARHRTDCLTAAVNNLKDIREFTARYRGLLSHYEMEGQHTNPASGNENGDVEQRNYRFKRATEQALLLRGSRDFESRVEYERFISALFDKVNRGRRQRLLEETPLLRVLPSMRLPVYVELRGIPVSGASTIRIRLNVYSVHSRLIGEHVDAHLHADYIDIYYKRTFVDRLPRLSGRGGHRINYRHIIDWLVRKPGAFAEYRYQADLFPTSNFRIAYDILREHNPLNAKREYVKILYCAARHSEDLTGKALEQLIAKNGLCSHIEVEQLVQWLLRQQTLPPSLGSVETIELKEYDRLLTSEEAT